MRSYICRPYQRVWQGKEYRVGTDPYETIWIENVRQAALVFAWRMAFKRYGRRAAVAANRVDCWSTDGRYVNFECFVGYRCENGGITGSNQHFTVYVHGVDDTPETG